MEGALHLMPLNKALTQARIPVRAGVVHGKKSAIDLKDRDVVASHLNS
jgi:hypothetical protein